MKIINYLFLFVIIGMMALAIMRECSHKKTRTKLETCETKYNNLHNAKSETIVKYDTVKIPYYITKTKFHAVDSVKVYSIYAKRVDDFMGDFDFDTIPIYTRTYEDTLTTPDFKLPYKLTVEGYLKSIQFANYELYTKSETIQHIVEVEKIKEIRRNHLYGYLMAGNDLQKWTSWTAIDVGLMFQSRRGWGLSLGYMRYADEDFAKVGFIMLLK